MEIPKYLYFRVRVINKGTRDFSSIGVELEDASDVDVVEVVRCKDCKYGKRLIDANGFHYVVCSYHYGHGIMVGNYDFCKWGERREDAETD